jgi:MFS family permease
MTALSGVQRQTGHLVADVLRRTVTRRIVVVFACFRVVEMGSWIAVTTLAYEFGGVRGASAVVVAQLAPAALAATWVGSIADRFGQVPTLGVGLGLQAAALGVVAALVESDAPHLAIYGAAILAAIAMVVARPTIATLVPRVVRSPRELTAVNAVIGWADGAACLVGPVITAVAIGVAGLGAPFVAFAVIGLVGSGAAFGLGSKVAPTVDEDGPRPSFVAALSAATRSRGSRSALVMLAAHAFVIGALDLLFVVVALDVLDGPAADAGWMSVAFGVGALLGGVTSVLLVARRELWPAIVGSSLLMAVALAALGVGDTPWSTALVFGAVGIGAGLLLVATRTLLQRVAELRVLCHTFAVAEAAEMAMLLAGALVVPLLVSWLSAQWAGAGVAVVMLVALAATGRGLVASERSAGAPLDRIDLLRHVPVFGLLSRPALETVARYAWPRHIEAGEVVITEGDVGEEFYVIESGEMSVRVTGREVNTLVRGLGFGELALLHDIPRTATVVALTDADLLCIDRETFLVAVGGSGLSVMPELDVPPRSR